MKSSDFPERDFWPASIRCCEPANLRPKPNGPLIRDYVRDGDFPTTELGDTVTSGLTTIRELLGCDTRRRLGAGSALLVFPAVSLALLA